MKTQTAQVTIAAVAKVCSGPQQKARQKKLSLPLDDQTDPRLDSFIQPLWLSSSSGLRSLKRCQHPSHIKAPPHTFQPRIPDVPNIQTVV